MQLNAVETTAAPTAAAKPWYEQLLSTVTQAIPVAAQAYTQQQIIDLQVERAKKGLPPIDAAAYTPAVQVTTDPMMKSIIVGGLLILGAALVLPQLRKR